MWAIFLTLFLSFFNPLYPLKHEVKGESVIKSAIYLTTGGESHCVEQEWGGCHITITGFHELHNDETFLQMIPQILQANSSIICGWRPEKVEVKYCQNKWRVILTSETLNAISRAFNKYGFQKVKGPNFVNSPFHIVLAHLNTQEDAEAYAQELKNKPWFITVVKEEPTKKFNWSKYYPL